MDLLLVSLSYGAQVICVFAATGETKQAATISRQIQIASNMSTSLPSNLSTSLASNMFRSLESNISTSLASNMFTSLESNVCSSWP